MRYAVGVMRWLSGTCVLVMGAASAVAQQGCTTDTAGALVRQRQGELLRQKIRGMEIKVPPMVRTQVGALKDALVKAVDESMRCAIVSEGAAAMEATLAKRLDANQPEKPFTPQAGEIDELEDGALAEP